MQTAKSLIGLAADLERLRTPGALWEGFAQAIARVGLTHFIYLTVNSERGEPDIRTSLVLDGAPLPPEDDPFLTYCCRSYEPTLTGIAHMANHPYLAPSAQAFIEAAAEQGFVSGLALPVALRDAPRFGGFNLGSPLGREDFAREILPLAESLHLLCLITDRRHRSMTAPPARRRTPPGDAIILTRRESDVLALMADGLSRPACAERLGLSTNTVSTHLKSAFQKLGARNIVEAARKFAENGSAPREP